MQKLPQHNWRCARLCEHSCEDTYLSEHGGNICVINCVYKRDFLCVCLLVSASTYPFVLVCVIWCVWCVAVKHNCLPAISFAYLSQPVRWVSGTIMHTVFHWQLWYSWSPTVMPKSTSSVVALADRHDTHAENQSIYQFVTSPTTLARSLDILHLINFLVTTFEVKLNKTKKKWTILRL